MSDSSSFDPLPPRFLSPDAFADRVVMQTLVFPDPAISSEGDLYFHRGPDTLLDHRRNALSFREGAQVWTDSYMNLLNLGAWTRHCRLGGLALRLAGQGRFVLRVTRLERWGGVVQEFEEITELAPEGNEFDLDVLLGPPDMDGAAPARGGIVILRLTALENHACLTGGAFLATCPDPTPVRLALSITTFRREAEVAASVARITRFLDARAGMLGADVHLFVVDNGGTACPAAHPRLTRVGNPNLGGAGGFARGLAEARAGGFTHCLFMDDDASMQMEALVRTIAFLRLARSPRAALAGAMISASRPWAMWENGAVFRGVCQPQFIGTDLRSGEAVIRMETAAARPKPASFYGGWWYFAFPVAEVTHDPFPFFVRGDDISFSLANHFDIATLNGVVTFQEDFSAKESALTLYLDLRNHLHHHLVHPALDIGAWGSAKVALRFWARSIVRMHYESAEAQLAAWEDVMRGPAFFAENADMAKRRPEIQALIRAEAWREEAAPGEIPPPPPEPGRWRTRLMKWTLNGHLLPFFGSFGREVTIPVDHRGLIWPLWGVRRARFVNAEADRAYTVTHSKRRFLSLSWRAARLAWRWRRAYPALRAAHREGYGDLTSPAFWQQQFAAERSAAVPAVR